MSAADGQIETARPDFAAPGAVVGWLLVLCLVLTVMSPASILYSIIRDAITKLNSHRATSIVLSGVYFVLFAAVAGYSITAGVKLWLLKPDAVRFAKRYLLTYLGAHIAFFIVWLLIDWPVSSVSLARMAWYHVVRPLPFVALWYSYLEHSRRVRATYPSEI
jgi:Protein of unknown function (DUF2569)